MKVSQIEQNLRDLMQSYDRDSFIYDLLLAYGLPKASITRLKKGNLDLSSDIAEVSWKKKVLFRKEYSEDLHGTISELASRANNNQRFVIATDFELFLAIDLATEEALDVDFLDLPRHFDFFLPWAGMEKTQHANENPADVRAAERMAKLFAQIKKDNPDDSPAAIHDLNVFMSRLLFCFFAEDTGIFSDGQFTNSINSHTQEDGSDLSDYLDKLFWVLDTHPQDRKGVPAFLENFPYVNGSLFRRSLKPPKFTKRSRRAVIESGKLDWSSINPDIFGSMMQAVITTEDRGGMGMHYTSVPNIMKVIRPLFLDELYDLYQSSKGNSKKVSSLLFRLTQIKIFDPACGSGNFLIIAYKELRRLEMLIFKENGMMALSGISLSQFYGIELDDFACEIAQLSLWLAEHQMNIEFLEQFGRTNPTLPLKEAGNIRHGNACSIDWETVCPTDNDQYIYVLGNPPYRGYSLQTEEQKADMAAVFAGASSYRKLDYITCWFLKGARYISGTAISLAFVSTNSICQGVQVAILWPLLYNENIEIGFAHRSFRWENNAKGNAGVWVIVIGLRNEEKKGQKYIFDSDRRLSASNINPYLSDARNVIVTDRRTPLGDLPKMVSGLKAGDNGYLILAEEEKEKLLQIRPEADTYVKRYVGNRDFVHGINRFCIWVRPHEFEAASQIPELKERFDKLRSFRLRSKKPATRRKAATPYAFDETGLVEANSILIPQTGSERREYLPIGFVDANTVISNGARAIYNSDPWIFALISSKMHMSWVKAVAGRLKMDMQYSNTLCYNTFPFPTISERQKDELTRSALNILSERENYSEKTLAQLYDPLRMPQSLRDVHALNDTTVEQCYRNKPFLSDEERLSYLLELYVEMLDNEGTDATLFENSRLQ